MFPGLFEDILGVRVFGYISFRVAMAGLTAFALALWLGRPTIAWLKRHRVGEPTEKTDVAELAKLSEATGKKNTPTMGGSFLMASLLVSVILWARLDNLHVVLGVLLTAGFAAVGFVDDYKKLTIPGCQGLSASAKMVGLSVVCLAVLGMYTFYAGWFDRPTLLALYPPFFKNASLDLATIGIVGVLLFVAFEWLVVVGTANAVNITDGLDGPRCRVCPDRGADALDLLLHHRSLRLDPLPEPALRPPGLGDGRGRRRPVRGLHGVPLVQRVPRQGDHGGTRARCPWADCWRGWRWSPSRSWCCP